VSQAGRERSGRWIAVLVASFALHLVALSAVSVDSRTTATWDSNAVDITFSVADPPPPAAVEPRTRKNPLVQVPVVAARRSRPTPAADQPALPKRTATSPTPSESELVLALDPNMVARAFVVSQQVAPSEDSGAEHEGTRAAEAGPRNYFEGVGDKRYLSVRDPPKLRRHQDGTHHYQGHAFKAVVEKDGSVTFDDGYGQGVTVRFDITDAIMRRRGEDPYRVEKNWFLEGTEEFRQELFERWRAKQTLLAIRKLRIRLLRVSEDGGLNESQKAARVIAMFRDTADDEAGASARTAIAEFVAERMPEIEIPIEPR